MAPVFLTAQWRELAMLNYEVDPALLQKFVPSGTELDHWNGRVFLSLVGFRFLHTRVFGLPIPFHRNFEEVNLRLYVRRESAGELKRGVVFIREIVPRRAIAAAARTLYHENYIARPMSHKIESSGSSDFSVEYAWKSRPGWTRMRLSVTGEPSLPDHGSQQQFIAEHYWGYSAQPDGGCIEYRVSHPAWRVWNAVDATFNGNVEDLYGSQLAAVLRTSPASVFLAEGSDVTVHRGARI